MPRDLKWNKSCILSLALILGLITAHHSLAQYHSNIPSEPRFTHVMSLMDKNVGSTLAIHQDKFGFMWFGGKSGLARFDGYEYVYYQHDVSDPLSLSNNVIWDIEEDEAGNLWLATENGLNFFDRNTQTFTHYTHDPNNADSLRHNTVLTLFRDEHGKFWLGTNWGLDQFDTETKSFSHYPRASDPQLLGGEYVLDIAQDSSGVYYLATGFGFKVWNPHTNTVDFYQKDESNPKSLINNLCRSVAVTRNGEVYVGTELGIHRFDPINKEFTRLKHPDITPNPIVWDIIEDSKGEIWLVGDVGGVARIDRETDSVIVYQPDPDNEDSIPDTVTRSVYEDVNGDIWVGRFPSGVSVTQRYSTAFKSVRHLGSDQHSIQFRGVNGISEDQEGNLWIGTDGGGIARVDKLTQETHYFTNEGPGSNSPRSNAIQGVHVARDGSVWFGMWNGGAGFYNPETEEFTNFLDNTEDNSIPQPHVSALLEARDGDFWLGSMEGGLTRYSPDTKELKTFFSTEQDGALSSNRVWALTESQNGDIWIGTHNGLDLLNPKTQTFRSFKHDPNDASSLSNNWVYSIFEDSYGILWVGTHGNGVSYLDPETNKFSHIDEKSGLSGNVVTAIIEDNLGNMWFSTTKGLNRYNRSEKSIRNFTRDHGIQSNLFNRGSAFKTRQGELIFGGSSGYTRFFPQNIDLNLYEPPVVLTGLEINNAPADSRNSDQSISKNILLETDIYLDHKQNIFTITYSALNYRIPKLNEYAYKLEGFDQNWQYVGDKRFASYTNLAPGKYVFKVKGSNNEKVWSSQVPELTIHIQAPPWRTWWAYTAYFLIIGGIVLFYVVSQRKIINYQQTIVERLQRVDRIKDEFISTTSHELKTPIFGIIGLAENLMDSSREKLDFHDINNLSMIISSSKRLASQVQDILDHSALEERNVSVDLTPVSLPEIVNLVVNMLKPVVNTSRVHLFHEIRPDSITVLADSERLQQILYNIITNAIKSTDFGSIKISHEAPVDGNVSIVVSDTGSGIPKENLDSLFDPFVQVDEADTREHGGAGLGLTIVKRLIELHGGKISVKSKLGEGTQVKFTLKTTDEVAKKIYVSEGLATKISSREFDFIDHSSVPTNPINKDFDPIYCNPDKQYHILVVDDEAVNRIILEGYLEKQNYRISVAGSGKEALRLFDRQDHIDLVLLDVMMPEMSGYEVCKTIRKRYSAAVLPVLFITAKSQVSDLEAAFEAGGNDFLPKPVTRQELLIRVNLHLRLNEAHIALEQKVIERTKDMERAYIKVEELSVRDALTGLHNRHYFNQTIKSIIAECDRTHAGVKLSVPEAHSPGTDVIFFVLDIDNFKSINDTYGHSTGDKILIEIAKRFQEEMREADYLFRWGGEEFLIITRNTSRRSAPDAAERFVSIVRDQPIIGDTSDFHITCSLGYCAYPPDPDSPKASTWNEVISAADKCMYKVKNSGKNSWAGIERHDSRTLPLTSVDVNLAQRGIILKTPSR